MYDDRKCPEEQIQGDDGKERSSCIMGPEPKGRPKEVRAKRAQDFSGGDGDTLASETATAAQPCELTQTATAR